MRTYITLTLCFALSALTAQTSDQFTDLQKEDFTAIFWEMKDRDINPDSVIVSLLTASGIDQERLGEIIAARARNEEIETTAEEKKLFQQIEEVSEELERSAELRLEAACQRRGMEVSTYMSMLERFRSNSAFQQSMKPFFEDFMKNEER